jgi:hypothetical protein
VPDPTDRPEDAATEARTGDDVSASASEPLEPLDVDGVVAILVGTIVWGVALVACLLLRDQLAADGRGWWVGACLAGFLLGLPGLWFVRRRRAAYAAR